MKHFNQVSGTFKTFCVLLIFSLAFSGMAVAEDVSEDYVDRRDGEVRNNADEYTDKRVSDVKENLEEYTEKRLSDVKSNLEQERESRLSDVKSNLESDRESRLQDVKQNLEGKRESRLQDVKQNLEEMRESRLNDVKDNLEEDRESRLDDVKQNLKDRTDREISETEDVLRAERERQLQDLKNYSDEQDEIVLDSAKEYSDKTDTGKRSHGSVMGVVQEFFQSPSNFIKEWVRDTHASEERADRLEDRVRQLEMENRNQDEHFEQIYNYTSMDRPARLSTTLELMEENNISEMSFTDRDGEEWSCDWMPKPGANGEQPVCVN